MALFQDLTEYTPADIQSLIDNNVEESIHLDFKESGALDMGDKYKNEIAKDVSAFANSDGGIIIYGVTEKGHHADSLSFVDGETYTKEWLEQIINSKISERIDDIKIYPIRFDDDVKKTVYVVKIPRSIRAPHMSSDHRYYRRYNFMSTQMEEYEVRDLFFRVNKTVLEIDNIFLHTRVNNDNDYFDLEIFSSIANGGTVPETIYKLNYYVTAPGGLRFDSISWDPKKDTMNDSIWKDGVKISVLGTMPLFPGERIDFGRFKVELKKSQAEDFIKSTTVRLVLFFQGGSVEKSFDLKQFYNGLFT